MPDSTICHAVSLVKHSHQMEGKLFAGICELFFFIIIILSQPNLFYESDLSKDCNADVLSAGLVDQCV